jgi:hypothetical protein
VAIAVVHERVARDERRGAISPRQAAVAVRDEVGPLGAVALEEGDVGRVRI